MPQISAKKSPIYNINNHTVFRIIFKFKRFILLNKSYLYMNIQVKTDIIKILKSTPDAEIHLDELVSELAEKGHDEQTVLRTTQKLVDCGKLSFSGDWSINCHRKVYSTGLVEPSEPTVRESEEQSMYY